MARKRLIGGQIDISVLLAFVFGSVFLLILLIFAVTFTNLSDIAKQIFITVLAIAAAGAGAVIPGLLKIKIPYAEAGGALAVFLLVFLNEPAIVNTVGRFVDPPKHVPDTVIGNYFDLIDDQKYSEAWISIDEEAKGFVAQNEGEFADLYKAAVDKIGEPIERYKIGTSGISSPSGYPDGFYKNTIYETKYSKGTCHTEQVFVRAKTSNSNWRIFSHNINPSPVPCR